MVSVIDVLKQQRIMSVLNTSLSVDNGDAGYLVRRIVPVLVAPLDQLLFCLLEPERTDETAALLVDVDVRHVGRVVGSGLLLHLD